MTSIPPSTTNPTPPNLHLPPQFSHTSPPPIIVTLGAESHLYKTHFLTPSQPCALKVRPSKPYRHPILDKRLTRHRILSEARTMLKLRREGIAVPGVFALDWEGGGGEDGKGGGWMMMEWIEGKTVKECLRWVKRRELEGEQLGELVDDLVKRIGRAVGKMHEIGVVHGDLTTSNLMVRMGQTEERVVNGDNAHCDESSMINLLLQVGEIVLIDFGLAGQSIQDEDKAVDLYVLERAFGSTHPEVEEYFQGLLKAYGESYKGAKTVLKKLEDVRMRGRKKSMIG